MRSFYDVALLFIFAWFIYLLIMGVHHAIMRRREKRRQEMKRAAQDAEALL